MSSPDADQEEDDGDEDDSAGDRDNDVEPQVEVGALRYAADFLGMPETREREKTNLKNED